MLRIRFVLTIILLSIAPLAHAQYHSEDPRLEKLFSTFISPCCWRENLTVHDSPIARELRGRIQMMVRDGRSNDEIKAIFVREYTKQVLSLPEGATGTWLFRTPWLAVLLGAGGVLFLLNRMRTRAPQVVGAGLPLPEMEGGWDLD